MPMLIGILNAIKNNWQLFVILIVGGCLFYAGWDAHGWVYAVEKAEAIKEQAKVDKEAQDKTNALLLDTQNKLAIERQKNLTLTQKWSAARANTKDCPLPADGISLFREAIGASKATP